jgi:hypothetical protein
LHSPSAVRSPASPMPTRPAPLEPQPPDGNSIGATTLSARTKEKPAGAPDMLSARQPFRRRPGAAPLSSPEKPKGRVPFRVLAPSSDLSKIWLRLPDHALLMPTSSEPASLRPRSRTFPSPHHARERLRRRPETCRLPGCLLQPPVSRELPEPRCRCS